MGRKKKPVHRVLAAALCLALCLTSGVQAADTAETEEMDLQDLPVVESVPAASSLADANTMDSYQGAMLDGENGNRYAGRVWSDKTVFAYGADVSSGGLSGNTLKLDEETDGFDGSLSFDGDFLNVYSTLGSTQLLYDELTSPFDLMIVLDMSGSMAQSTLYPIESRKSEGYEETMAERIENSRIQKTLDAVNEIIDSFMDQNKQNRVGVCVYGANAALLMPLAHYKKVNDEPYLTVGGMETLYERADYSTVEELMQENPGQTFEDGIWNVNRDACYTVVANAYYDTSNEAPDSFVKIWNRTISNNVKNDILHPDPDLNGDGRQLLADQYVGYMTNTQGGIYLGMKQLAQTKERTFTGTRENGEEVVFARIPAAIILTDGGANFAFNDPAKDAAHELPGNTGDEWYDVYLPEGDITDLYNDGVQQTRLLSIPAYEDGGIFYDSDADVGGTPSTILEVLMTASYMKVVVDRHYRQGWERDHATEDSRMPLKIYTVSVDAVHLPAWGRYRIYPTMNPEIYFNDTRWNDSNYDCIGNDFRSALPWRDLWDNQMTDLLPYTYNKWEEWKKLTGPGDKISVLADWLGNAESGGSESVELTTISNQILTECATLRIGRLPTGYFYVRENEQGRPVERIRVTNEDIIDNILYPDEFYDVESEDLRNVFQDIMDSLRGDVPVPVEGYNEAGIDDSVTYQDKLGTYMEIPKGSITIPVPDVEEGTTVTVDMAALLFGELHGINRQAVYDPAFNDAYMTRTEEEQFPEGWYKGEDGKKALYRPPEESPLDPEENGWIYRIGKETLRERIPARVEESLSEEGIVYTLYGFADSEEEQNRLRINPVYGSIVSSNLTSEWEALEEKPAGNDFYRDETGVYRLADITIWTEESTGEEEQPDTLYVNIPAAALPTQAYWISIGWDGPADFQSNLDEKWGSTPFRLFYGVGLDRDLIKVEEGETEAVVDLDSLPREYQKTHQGDSFGSVYFLSNEYTGTQKGEYGIPPVVYQGGDSRVTFSPSLENPYYQYQEPLALYTGAYQADLAAGLVSVDETDGSEYMGTYRNEAAFESARESLEDRDGVSMIRDSSGIYYPYRQNGIVFLERDLLIPGGDGTPLFHPNDRYFFVEKYYVPEGDGSEGGTAVGLVRSVTGTDFQLEENTDEAVCWADQSGGIDLTVDYEVSDDGDTTLGAPTGEKITLTGKKLRKYLLTLGFSRQEERNSQQAYWEEIQQEFLSRLDTDEDDLISMQEYDDAGYRWALSIKPGCLRSEDLYRYVRTKETNISQSSENDFVSAITRYDGLGEELVICSYLGNDGRIIIDNPLIYITSRIDTPIEESEDTKFHYQIYIRGFTGEEEAILLGYSPYLNEGKGGWQQQVAELRLETDDAGLVLGASGSEALVDRTGHYLETPSVEEGESFYVYLAPDGEDDHQRLLYLSDKTEDYDSDSAPDGMGCCTYVTGDLPENSVERGDFWNTYRFADEESPSGTMEFYCKDVWLIPVEEVRELPGRVREEEDESATESLLSENNSLWSFDPDHTETYIHLGYGDGKGDPDYNEKIEPFVAARMEPVGVDASAHVTSDYRISTTLLTKTLYFGTRQQEGQNTSGLTGEDLLDSTPFWADAVTCAAVPGQQRAVMETQEYIRAEESGNEVTWLSWDEVAGNTADFYLGEDEGLMLTIRLGSGYRVTEEGAGTGGFLLKEAVQESDSREVHYAVNDVESPNGSSIVGAWTAIPRSEISRHKNCGRFPNGADEYQGNTPVRHWSMYDALQTDYSSSGQTALEPGTRFTSGKEGLRIYSVYGNVEGDLEGVHYVNEYTPASLVVANWLKSAGGNVSLEDADIRQEFLYTLTLTETDGDTPLDADLDYVVTGYEDNEPVEMIRGTFLSRESEGSSNTDISPRKKGVWEFALKGDQQITISGLTENCYYTVKQEPVSGFLESGAPNGTRDKDQAVTVTGILEAGEGGADIVSYINRKTGSVIVEDEGINLPLWILLGVAVIVDIAAILFVHMRRNKSGRKK